MLKIYIIFGRKGTPQKMDHVRVEQKEKQTNDKCSNLESESNDQPQQIVPLIV